MRGHIRKRGRNHYEVIVEAGKDLETGKRRQTSRTVRGPKSEADALLAHMVATAPRNRVAGRTFGLLLEAWYEHRSSDWSPSNRPKRRLHIDRYLMPTLGKVQLRDLTAEHLDRLLRKIRDEGKLPTAIAVRNSAHAALELGVRWEWLRSNPAKNTTRLPKEPKRESTTPTPAEVLALLDKADAWLATAIRLAAVTGVRRGQLAALRWSDVDLDNLTAIFARNIVVGAKRELVEKPCGDIKRGAGELSIDPDTAKALMVHKDLMQERVASAGGTWSEDLFVFSFDPFCKKPPYPTTFTSRFMDLRDSLGLKVRLHDLRHFVGTSLADEGFPAVGIRDRLSHSSLTTTNRYIGTVKGRDVAAAEIMRRLLSRDLGRPIPDEGIGDAR